MIKDTNTRLSITFSKKQADWILSNAKRLKMTTSQFVKFLIDKNIGHLIFKLPKEKQEILFKIAKTPWLDFDTRSQEDESNPLDFLLGE